MVKYDFLAYFRGKYESSYACILSGQNLHIYFKCKYDRLCTFSRQIGIKKYFRDKYGLPYILRDRYNL